MVGKIQVPGFRLFVRNQVVISMIKDENWERRTTH